MRDARSAVEQAKGFAEDLAGARPSDFPGMCTEFYMYYTVLSWYKTELGGVPFGPARGSTRSCTVLTCIVDARSAVEQAKGLAEDLAGANPSDQKKAARGNFIFKMVYERK